MALDLITNPDFERLQERARDYHRMEKALAWLAERWSEHPTLDEAAAAVGLSPFHFQRIFTRWAGVSPKTFVAAIAHAEARRSLESGESVLGAALDAGLSGPSRLHDLFIAHEAVTPGEARRRGEGLELRWGLAPTPFGQGLFVMAPRGLCGLAFTEEDGGWEQAFGDMHGRWPAAAWIRDDKAASKRSNSVPMRWRSAGPMRMRETRGLAMAAPCFGAGAEPSWPPRLILKPWRTSASTWIRRSRPSGRCR